MIQEIKSRQNQKIKDLQKYEIPAYCKENGRFKVEGFHLFELAKNSGQLLEIFTLKPIENIDKNIKQFVVTKEIMEKISSSKTPQGIVAICSIKPVSKITGKKVLYLDGVSDPGNVGTILRTALAFGYKDVVLSEGSCSPFSSKVIQASQGAIFDLNIVQKYELEKLKNDNYLIIATELKSSVYIDELDAVGKHVLVLGNEAHGVSERVLDLADKRVKIKIDGIESLNVAIAGAIAMYALSIK